MPVIFRHKGYVFFFFSNEGNPLEPLHVHVRKNECIAKVWLAPEVSLGESYGFSSAELREILGLAEENRDRIERGRHEYFGV